jgi:hypothetical protein
VEAGGVTTTSNPMDVSPSPAMEEEEEPTKKNPLDEWMPAYSQLALVARVYNDELVFDTYSKPFTPELVITPRSIGEFVKWGFPLISKHKLLREAGGVRVFWRVWFSPASSQGITPQLATAKLVAELLGMAQTAKLPSFTEVERVGALEKFMLLLPAYGKAAREHYEAMKPIVPVWLSVMDSIRRADTHTITTMRAKHKRNPSSHHHVRSASGQGERRTVWETELRECFAKNWDALKPDQKIPKYASPNNTPLADAMNERIIAGLHTQVWEWRDRAVGETRQKAVGANAPPPRVGTVPLIHRIQFWVESECADVAALIQNTEATAGASKFQDEFTDATYAALVRAAELHLRKMNHLTIQMSLPEEKRESPETRVARCMFVHREVPGKDVPGLSSENSLFDVLVRNLAIQKCAGTPFKSPGTPEDVQKRVKDKGGSVRDFLEVLVEDDTKMGEQVQRALDVASRKRKGGV